MKNFQEIKDISMQFIKFGMVGAINTILTYLITNVGYYIMHLHAQVSNLIAFVITVFISFILNGKYVFQDYDNNKEKSWIKRLLKVYASYSITGLFLTAILLYIEETLFGIQHYIATLMNLIITIPINFLLNKLWAYK